MDKIEIGMQVEIRRSDGRIHKAVITGINYSNKEVDVEWFEKKKLENQIPSKSGEFNSFSKIFGNSEDNKNLILSGFRIGMTVDIQRSNGRIHEAVITGIDYVKEGINVEWIEKGEIKGKEIDFSTLFLVNPSLNSANKTSEVVSNRISKNLGRKNLDTVFKVPKLPSKKETTSNRNLSLLKTGAKTSCVNFEMKDTTFVRNTTNNEVELPKNISKITDPEAKSDDLFFIEKYGTVNEVENLQEEKIKKTKKMIDFRNPNWKFYSMIYDYRKKINFDPLRMEDTVTDSRITVCVRKRPLSKSESSRREIDVVTIPNKNHLVVHQPQAKVDMTKYLENQIFKFDYTFDENSSNEMIYKFTTQPLVETIFEKGFATCFAYGQTGSGKTHTMGGDLREKIQNFTKGIYFLTAIDVFRILERPEYKSLKLEVRCSFFEIYGGKVFDLLSKRAGLRILEDGKKSVQICGLKEFSVSCPDDVMKLIKIGSLQRTAGSTLANFNSSRSHGVFQIILKQDRKNEIFGKISLIDLAGNEKGSNTTSSDRETRLEGAEINKSLLALKECIRAMSMKKKHIPFRQSKLTLVLRDSFTNKNAKTCMIAMVSPGMSSAENTLNTLRYADRVKELGTHSDVGLTPRRATVTEIAS